MTPGSSEAPLEPISIIQNFPIASFSSITDVQNVVYVKVNAKIKTPKLLSLYPTILSQLQKSPSPASATIDTSKELPSPSPTTPEKSNSSPKVLEQNSWRRVVKSTSGLPLFELRQHNYLTENNWLVETPSGREMAKIKHMSRFAKQHSALDVTIHNNADKGNEMGLLVRRQDNGLQRNHYFGHY
ncbi:hypothetical protein BKA61DRAFT_576244 [Leptodontidium sp. MPI-SDFR-AT-0119]|nr:hypothetical protein BKA61DRAFT_576244 [Leptodontidium sp. MPI-SDFR-AT-0119]